MQCVPDAYGRGPPHLGAVPHAQSTVGGAVWPLSSPLTSGSSVVLWALPSQRLHPGLLDPFLSAIASLLHAHPVSPLGHEWGQAVPGSLLPFPSISAPGPVRLLSGVRAASSSPTLQMSPQGGPDGHGE